MIARDAARSRHLGVTPGLQALHDSHRFSDGQWILINGAIVSSFVAQAAVSTSCHSSVITAGPVLINQ